MSYFGLKMKLENFRRQWDSNTGKVGKASKMSRYALKKDNLLSFLQGFEVETITKIILLRPHIPNVHCKSKFSSF